MTDEELKQLGEKINASGSDIVWIGLSTPKQEYFAKSLLPYVNVHFIVTVGAAFDFHSGHLKKAPGFLTNMGVLTAIAGRDDVIFSDRLNHASLIDGASASRAEVKRYRHCSVEHLSDLVRAHNCGGQKFTGAAI